jgi:hypothetical protein
MHVRHWQGGHDLWTARNPSSPQALGQLGHAQFASVGPFGGAVPALPPHPVLGECRLSVCTQPSLAPSVTCTHALVLCVAGVDVRAHGYGTDGIAMAGHHDGGADGHHSGLTRRPAGTEGTGAALPAGLVAHPSAFHASPAIVHSVAPGSSAHSSEVGMHLTAAMPAHHWPSMIA